MLAQGQKSVRTLGGALGALFAVLFLLLLSSPSAAQVITFSSASASWRDAQDNVPGSQPGDPVITNGVPTSSISWGGSTPQSGYDVTITIPDPTQFPVADFTHRNFTVPDPSLTSVVLDIVIDFEVDGIPLGPLTFTFTFTHEETPNNLDPCPYPTPPGEGCTDRVTFLDAPLPTTFTVGGKTYTLGLTFLDESGDPVDEFITSEGGVANSAELDVAFALVPPVFEVTKSGPASLAPGQAGVFTIDAQNTGPNDAFDTTIRDLLPDGATGGMCDATPQVLSAQVFESNGATPVPGKGPLLQGTDFALSYTAAPTCELTLTMLSAASVVAENERLIITYQTQLDGGTQFGVSLENVAGATEWFDDDPSNPLRGTYTEALSNGTVGVVDHEDAHTLDTDPLDYLFEKTVHDPVSGALLTMALPGDTLRYRLRLENRTAAPLVGLGFTDEIDRLNASPLFEAGSLTLATLPVGADTSGTDPNGGAAGTGLVDVRNISVAPGDSVVVEFDVTLANPIADGTLITDQAELRIADLPFGLSDDPGVNGAADPFTAGDEDPTVLPVAAVADFQVEKVSADLTGSAALLLPGDILQYTITVRNLGTLDVTDGTIRDAIPVNTSYVAGSTTLNGTPVPDSVGGLAPFVTGLPLSVPADPTPGSIPADASGAAANTATLTFQVTVDPGVVDGTVLSNQAFVSALAAAVSDQPSDDPATPLVDDPTLNVVGNLPLLFATKQVALAIGGDGGTPGVIDPGDTLHYTITIFNTGTAPATGAMLADAVPTNTSWVSGSLLLNGEPVADGGVSPLIAGIDVSSSDLTPPLPGPGAGILTPGESAVVEFDVLVAGTAPVGAIISNQATLATNERPDLLSDGDGDPATGPEPTVVVVGDAQQLAISKQVSVVGGGAALAGSTLEYVVTVQNIASVNATQVIISDDLDPNELALVPGSATLDGLPAGIGGSPTQIIADYGASYGPLVPGDSTVLRFRAVLDPGLAIGDPVVNTAVVTWNNATQNEMASVSLTVGGVPGVGLLSGAAWHDADFDLVQGGSETDLVGWSVELLRNGQLLQTVLTDASGAWSIGGVPANDLNGDQYELVFSAPGAGANTAALGRTDSPFTNGMQRISDLVVSSGSVLQDLNLPIQPNGVVYDAVQRTPIAGAIVNLLDAGTGGAVPDTCFDDTAQQGQVTPASGQYKFELNFSPGCPSPGDYRIAVTPPDANYVPGASQIVPPTSDISTAPYPVPACLSDAVGATGACEAVAAEAAPQPPSDPTVYYLHLRFDDTATPQSSQIYNNHVPLDPDLQGAVGITKTASLVNVSRGQQVPYQITLNNTLGGPIPDLSLVDRFPVGFKYVDGSARVDGEPMEPVKNGRELTWPDLGIDALATRRVVLLLAVGAGVSEGEFVNHAQAFSSITGNPLSGDAAATVRVVPDPTFDCTDVTGKVFDDPNHNGVQERGEDGLAGVRVATARGLVATTDEYGRFHITCAVVPREGRGSNFVLKLDDRSLPSGYRPTTARTQVKRATRGKAIHFRFGATIHRVVGLDLADAVFEPGSTEMREHWASRLDVLLAELEKAPSLLRLSYLADVESEDLVEDRVDAMKDEIERSWEERDAYPLTIETEIFWSRGRPVERSGPSDEPPPGP